PRRRRKRFRLPPSPRSRRRAWHRPCRRRESSPRRRASTPVRLREAAAAAASRKAMCSAQRARLRRRRPLRRSPPCPSRALRSASTAASGSDHHGYFDIGIAVGSWRGLVVPILRDADQMSFAEVEKKIADFGKRAQDGKLTIEELTGGTFSISNGGVFGSML